MVIRCLAAVAVLMLSACGPVIGDACTVNTECGPGVCINRDFAPGGLCSQVCTPGNANTCPAGSTCVNGILDGDTPGCLHSCNEDKDCRPSYVCRSERNALTKVCVGPNGL